ncbi:MAG: hypothetical protein QM647_16440 [Asticcacaulis sp.]|uniref:hypothetical protein n=1 Tax=Asticcacaulis sp. TaxID=1872648 RepID=UPI0039E67EA0
MRIAGFLALAGGLVLAGLSPAAMAETVTVKVSGTAMPWVIKKKNPDLPYGKNDGTAPAVAPLKLTAGMSLQMTATGSTTTVAGGGGFDPGGQQEFICDDHLGGSGMPFPSMYMAHGFYPVHLNELVAVFTDSKGKIVKSPFPIGTGMNITVPEGAEAIQFGLNDDIYADNSGEIEITLTAAAQ